MRRVMRPLMPPRSCYNNFGGFSCWKDLTKMQHLNSSGFCFPILQGLRRFSQQDYIENNLNRTSTNDSMTLSNVRFDIEFPRYIFPFTS